MIPLYEKNFMLRTNDFDRFGNILPCAILDLFQTVAGEHAILLGAGFDDMLKKQYVWVLVKTKYEIVTMPKRAQEVIVKTWPLQGGKITFQRETVITDNSGKTLVKGSSEWVVIHSEKRRIMPAKDVYNLDDALLLTDKNFEGKFAKVPNFETEKEGNKAKIGFCDFDLNGHVNNTKYANYVLNAINPSDTQKIKEMQVDYNKEITKNEELVIYLKNEDNLTLAKGKNQNDETMFSAKILWQK